MQTSATVLRTVDMYDQRHRRLSSLGLVTPSIREAEVIP